MSKYNYAEAFCLMEYWCRRCKSREIIWNSRDGLTPYEIKCRQCGHIKSMCHSNFREDVCIPNYVPFKGNRIFVGDTEWPVLVTFGEESLEERKKELKELTDIRRPHTPKDVFLKQGIKPEKEVGEG